MIIIAGSSHDDILYFESIMSNKKEETLFNRYTTVVGNIFNQEVLLVYGIYTNYVSSAVMSYLIAKYFVVVIFNVGKCIAFSNDYKNGDIVVSSRVYLADVDQIDEKNTQIGQIPGFDVCFKMGQDILDSLGSSLENRTLIPNKRGFFISSNTVYRNREELSHLGLDDEILGMNEKLVLDSTSGGCALSCEMLNIPFVAVKVVHKHIGKRANVKDYANVLKSYTGIGKAIVTCIGNISRNDIIREDE